MSSLHLWVKKLILRKSDGLDHRGETRGGGASAIAQRGKFRDANNNQTKRKKRQEGPGKQGQGKRADSGTVQQLGGGGRRSFSSSQRLQKKNQGERNEDLDIW